MPELDYITIKGFKSIASVEKLKLGPINIIIGPNGSGKSNLVGVFSFLHAIREGRLQEYTAKVGGAERILHFGSKSTKNIEFHLSFRDEVDQYKLLLDVTENDQLYPHMETVYYWNKQQYSQPYAESLLSQGMEAGVSNPDCARVAGYVRQRLGSWRLYHFHDTSATSPMKKTADLNDNRYLRPDGSNLAAFLYYLQEKHEAAYGLIRRAIQETAPFFDDFQLEPSKLSPDKIRLEWRHKNSDAYFDVSSLSDGTLRYIALATLFLQPEAYRPSIILVDEPELGLHPQAINMLASLIKLAAVETQVIVATQSSLLVDNFQPEDILVADRVGSGTQFSRLDPEKLEVRLKDYGLGQLWEKNEFGGRPGNE